MSRLKTDKERQDKIAYQRKEKRIQKGNPYVKTVIKPVDTSKLNLKAQDMVLNTKRGWITRNSRCPCNSGKRFKKCCMKTV